VEPSPSHSAAEDSATPGCGGAPHTPLDPWPPGPGWGAGSTEGTEPDTPGQGASVFAEPTNRANGLTRDLQGRLLAYEHDSRRVTRQEADGVPARQVHRRKPPPRPAIVDSESGQKPPCSIRQ
jgi:hypothetical protein